MGSGSIIYVSSFTKASSGIQKLMVVFTDTQTVWRSHKPILERYAGTNTRSDRRNRIDMVGEHSSNNGNRLRCQVLEWGPTGYRGVGRSRQTGTRCYKTNQEVRTQWKLRETETWNDELLKGEGGRNLQAKTISDLCTRKNTLLFKKSGKNFHLRFRYKEFYLCPGSKRTTWR